MPIGVVAAGSFIVALSVVTVFMHVAWFAYIALWWRRKRTRMEGFSHAEIREWIKSDPIYDAFAFVCSLLLWLWLPFLWLQHVIIRKVRTFLHSS